MVVRRNCFKNLKNSYLFPEINRRRNLFLEKNPEAKIISLGIGDTVLPFGPTLTNALATASIELGTQEGYVGYGDEQGVYELREKIASEVYKNRITPDEIFISDGAKCDIGRLQTLFGKNIRIGLQDPSYPVYIEGSIIQDIDEIICIPCPSTHNFFPELSQIPPIDLLYICSPNNPTGAVYSHEELQKLVSYAKSHHILILFDGAYSSYIQDPLLPRTIFEIEGAREVAIEVNSFSKYAGFTGLRLGWSVIPRDLVYEGGESIWKDWKRLNATIFNGASILSQKGGIAVFEKEGMDEIQSCIDYYMKNARALRSAFANLGYQVFGGENAPYLWVQVPNQNSWDLFQEYLEKYHLIITPGSGFGPAGEGFIRISAFAFQHHIEEAVARLRAL